MIIHEEHKMKPELVFADRNEMIEFLSSCRYDDYVTYFDPIRGWIVNLNERYGSNEHFVEDGQGI